MSLSSKSYGTIGELLEKIRDKGGRYVDNPDFVVEGFPRSANTFLVTALNMSWPSMAVQSHNHDSKYLKAACGSIPVVSVIRNPTDAIISCAIHLSLEEPDRVSNLALLIGIYGDMAKQALDNSHVFAIPFEKVTSDVIGTLDLLEAKYGLKNRVQVSPEEVLNQTRDLSKQANLTSDAFTKRGHVPRDRDPSHSEVLAKLQSPEYEKALSRLTKLYDSLMARYDEETQGLS